MQSILRIEIVIPKLQLEKLLSILEKHNLPGYTVLQEVQGKGERGVQDGGGLTGAFSNSMVILGCSPEEFDQVKEPVRTLLHKIGGVCMASSAQWLIH